MGAGPVAPRPVIPRRGAVLKIQEDNYRYGEDALVLRVTAVGEVQHQADGDWLMVAGVQVGRNGAEVGQRQVAVRLSSLVPQRGPR
jgi:hypothetical protein